MNNVEIAMKMRAHKNRVKSAERKSTLILNTCKENVEKLNLRVDWIQEEVQKGNIKIDLHVQRWLDELEFFAMEAKENLEDL